MVTAAPGPGPRYASAPLVALELMLVLGPVAIAMLLGISRPRRSQVEPGTVRLAALSMLATSMALLAALSLEWFGGARPFYC